MLEVEAAHFQLADLRLQSIDVSEAECQLILVGLHLLLMLPLQLRDLLEEISVDLLNLADFRRRPLLSKVFNLDWQGVAWSKLTDSLLAELLVVLQLRILLLHCKDDRLVGLVDLHLLLS